MVENNEIKATVVKVYNNDKVINKLKQLRNRYNFFYNKVVEELNIMLKVYRDNKDIEQVNLKELKKRLFDKVEQFDTSKIPLTVLNSVISYLIYRFNLNVINIKRGHNGRLIAFKQFTDINNSLHIKNSGYNIIYTPGKKNLKIEILGTDIVLNCRGRADFNYSDTKFITIKFNRLTNDIKVSINR